jgi:hypothetical protein
MDLPVYETQERRFFISPKGMYNARLLPLFPLAYMPHLLLCIEGLFQQNQNYKSSFQNTDTVIQTRPDLLVEHTV